MKQTLFMGSVQIHYKKFNAFKMNISQRKYYQPLVLLPREQHSQPH